MCTLADFPPVSNDGEIPICLINGQVQFSSPNSLNVHLFTDTVVDHPKVVITKVVLQQSLAKTYLGEIFLPGSDTLLQRLQDAWYENGSERVIRILQQQPSFVINRLANAALFVYSIYQKAINSLSYPTESDAVTVNDVKVMDPVICIAWHPHATKLAVATRDDSVTVYYSGVSICPVLKWKAQRRITAVAWRPLSATHLAVACSAGVFMWTVEPKSLVSRTSFSNSVHLPDKYVTCLAWSPQGDILITSNSRDHHMIVWNPDTCEKQILVAAGRGGVSHLTWSLNGAKLLAATNTKLFRVWNTSGWSAEKWNTQSGPVVASVWSSDASVLLFCTKTENFLYGLYSRKNVYDQSDEKNIGVQFAADFTRVLFDNIAVGGEVKDLAWDPTDHYLAVIFHDCPLVAVFFTDVSLTFMIQPGFFISGLGQEAPSHVCFQSNFQEGANLTICWSSGRVQYFPMVKVQKSNSFRGASISANGLKFNNF